MATILVVAEHAGGKLRRATLHGLAAARAFAARTGGEVRCAVVGDERDGLAAIAGELAAAGAPVHLLVGPGLGRAVASVQARALADLVHRLGATCVCAAATAYSRDLLPRVAARLEAAMASDVLGFGGEGAAPTFVRPMWAGNVLAEVELATPVQVFSVRATEFAPAPPAGTPGAVLREEVPGGGDAGVRLLGFVEQKGTRPELTEARVVVSGGRGTKGDFRCIEELADALGGAVGASRAAVDAGWAPNDWQVGQTGKVVAPELYVAAGISGAIQHLAGMKGSRVVVAVNKDPEAPIFGVADYGLVADLFQALPALTARVKGSR